MSELKNPELKRIFKLGLDRIEESCKSFPWENKRAYGHWLAQTYYFVRHTTSFLGLASSRFGHWQRERQYHLISHLREEAGHDIMVLEDLKALGFDIKDFPELPETSAFYQSQYYFIEHENPIAHFGYSLCLEGLAAKKFEPFYQILTRHYGPDVCRFAHLHCVVDKEHFDNALKTFNDLSSAEAGFVARNLEQSCALYVHILEHIKEIIAGGRVHKSNDGKAA